MNIEQARFNMVEQQIRTWDVLDPVILNLISTLKRESFVPVAHQALAFADLEIPIGHGQRMWTPKLEARVVQDLQLAGSESVLEIGTGSGYLTALLAARSAQVTSVEIVPALAESARIHLADAGIYNAEVIVGDGMKGHAARGPFDVIVFGGSMPVMHAGAWAWLKPEGKLFAIIGSEPVMFARVFTRSGAGGIVGETLFETVVPALLNAPQAKAFVF